MENSEQSLGTATGPTPPRQGWYYKFRTMLFVVFCFEIGIFLLIFPWLDPWPNNWLADWIPFMRGVWENAYFRGAVSGLGAINLYISFSEVFRFRRA